MNRIHHNQSLYPPGPVICLFFFGKFHPKKKEDINVVELHHLFHLLNGNIDLLVVKLEI